MRGSIQNTSLIGYRQPAPDPHESRTGSRYDWLCVPHAQWRQKWSRRLSDSNLANGFPLFWGTRSLVKGRGYPEPQP